MDKDTQTAYEWAKNQNYQSVAARYAKTLANDIDRLTADLAARDKEIERLQEAQRWIPVTERLPEPGQYVLLLHNYHAMIGEHGEYESITVGYYHKPADRRAKPYFYYVGVSDYGDMVRASSMCPGSEFITHWMPLPEPPESRRGDT